MARAYSNDLRCRIPEVYEREKERSQNWRGDFRVSAGYVRKIREQQRRTGKKERIPSSWPHAKIHRSDPRATPQLAATATRFDVGGSCRKSSARKSSVRSACPSPWAVLNKIGLQLKKKSHSTRVSERAKSISSGALLAKAPTRSHRRN